MDRQFGRWQAISLVAGAAALIFATWLGIHVAHLLEEVSSRHVGESIIAAGITLGLFTWAKIIDAKRRSPV